MCIRTTLHLAVGVPSCLRYHEGVHSNLSRSPPEQGEMFSAFNLATLAREACRLRTHIVRDASALDVCEHIAAGRCSASVAGSRPRPVVCADTWQRLRPARTQEVHEMSRSLTRRWAGRCCWPTTQTRTTRYVLRSSAARFARDDSDGYARCVFSPACSAARVRTGLSSAESPSRPPAAARRTCSCQLANQRVRMGPATGKAGRVGGVATARP